MPIVVKEVIVKTTVERTLRQEPQMPDAQLVERVKRRVLAELADAEPVSQVRRDRKNR